MLISRVAASALAVTGSVGASAAISLAIAPNTQTIIEGKFATVEIRIGGLGAGEAPSLGTYDLDVMFNPTVLGFVSAALGDIVLGDQLDLFSLGSVSSVTASTGRVNLFELSLDTAADLNTLQAGSFVVASVRFSGLSVGTSPIELTVNGLGDADGTPLAASVLGGSVVVSAVPEPGSYALMLAGIGLVGVLARRRRARPIG